MTENEIKEYVTKIRHKADIFRKSGFETTGIIKAFDKSADIIEELLPYMAIGTIEQLEWCKDASHWKELFKEKLEKYEAIGTVEDIQEVMALCKSLQETTCKYMDIGTIEEFKALKEKEERFDRNIRMFNEIGLEIRSKAIDEFAHQLKETLNQEFPSNYESTRPYFSLENARLIVDDVEEQMKGGAV